MPLQRRQRTTLLIPGVKESKIKVILNGVDGLTPVSTDEKRIIKERFNLPDGYKAVSIVARLEDIKGHDYFIEAADRLLQKGIKARFYIAGTGSYENHLKEKVKNMNRQEQIIFTGFISDVDKLMSITDVQANASFGTEATSLALLEGMSLGIPAVVSDFGGNPGVIKNGQNGYIVPKQNQRLWLIILKYCLQTKNFTIICRKVLKRYSKRLLRHRR